MNLLKSLALVGLVCLAGSVRAQQRYYYVDSAAAKKKEEAKKAEPKKKEAKKEEAKKDEPYILGPHEKKCPNCGKKVCHVEYKWEKAKKTVYEIECKAVCIPGISFPKLRCSGCGKCTLFGKCGCPEGCGCGEPRCGRVRMVKVLREKEIECGEVCKCKWNIETCPEPCHTCEPGCAGNCEGGCPGAPYYHEQPPLLEGTPPAYQYHPEPLPTPHQVPVPTEYNQQLPIGYQQMPQR